MPSVIYWPSTLLLYRITEKLSDPKYPPDHEANRLASISSGSCKLTGWAPKHDLNVLKYSRSFWLNWLPIKHSHSLAHWACFHLELLNGWFGENCNENTQSHYSNEHWPGWVVYSSHLFDPHSNPTRQKPLWFIPLFIIKL